MIKRLDFIARQMTGMTKYDLDKLANTNEDMNDGSISGLSDDDIESINRMFNDTNDNIVPKTDNKGPDYGDTQFLKLLEDNSKYRYKVSSLQDRVSMLEDNLVSNLKSHSQKLK